MKHPFQNLDETTRRAFLESVAKSAFGVTILPSADALFGARASATLSAPARRAEHVIYLMMNGAMSHIDSFDPKPESDSGGETQAIQTSVSGVRIGEHMPKLAKLMDQVALIRSMTTETGAHEQGRYLMRTSYKMIGSIRHPFIGAWLTHFEGKLNRDLPGSVLVGTANRHPAQGFLSAEVAPAPVASANTGLQNTKPPKYLDERNFDKRRRLISRFEAGFSRKYPTTEVNAYADYYSEAVRLLKSADLVAFDIKKEEESVRQTYGANRTGQGCLLARRLIEHKVRCVEVEIGGWDNHRDIYDTFPTRAAELDTAIAALLNDLKEKGLLGKTLVVLTTEFGRTPKINANAGRDHHPGAFSSLLAGAGIQGGSVIGLTDKDGRAVEDGHCLPADFNATIAQACGLPLNEEVYSPSNRPFKVAHDGNPLMQLFS